MEDTGKILEALEGADMVFVTAGLLAVPEQELLDHCLIGVRNRGIDCGGSDEAISILGHGCARPRMDWTSCDLQLIR